jgi:hypothetical protein
MYADSAFCFSPELLFMVMLSSIGRIFFKPFFLLKQPHLADLRAKTGNLLFWARKIQAIALGKAWERRNQT